MPCAVGRLCRKAHPLRSIIAMTLVAMALQACPRFEQPECRSGHSSDHWTFQCSRVNSQNLKLPSDKTNTSRDIWLVTEWPAPCCIAKPLTSFIAVTLVALFVPPETPKSNNQNAAQESPVQEKVEFTLFDGQIFWHARSLHCVRRRLGLFGILDRDITGAVE